MFANLTEALKRRIILELRRFWAADPRYRDVLVDNIQGKYAFTERPQMGIVLKGSSANQLPVSADNFQGTLVSYCHLTKVYGKNGNSIEWVREDTGAIRRNHGVFPSPRGVYFVEVRQESNTAEGCITPVNGGGFVFYVDPLLDVVDEAALRVSPLVYQTSQGAFHEGSLRVYFMPGNAPLMEGKDYTADALTGVITLVRPPPPRGYVSIDYRYPGTSVGPFPVFENTSNNTAIPGVTLAFGRRIEDEDVMAVVVGDRREPSALEYGGKWDVSLDMDILARDPIAQMEILDKTLMFLFAITRSQLAEEGIEIVSVSSGGEAEEVYDETGDDYYYTASISLQIQADWSLHVPIDGAFTRLIPVTVEAAAAAGALSDDQLAEAGSPTDLKVMQDLRLLSPSDPFYRDRTRDFEMIR